MYKKILIPTDGSVLGELAAQEGIDVAAKLGAEVMSIHVAREYQKSALKSNPVTPDDYEAGIKEEGARMFKPLADHAEQAGVKFSSSLYMANHPAYVIVEAAKKHNCDLIFMGSNGCAGWHEILMGSVTSKVLSSTQLPVLVHRVRREELPAEVSEYSDSLFSFPPA